MIQSAHGKPEDGKKEAQTQRCCRAERHTARAEKKGAGSTVRNELSEVEEPVGAGMTREKVIVRTSVIGIAANVFLAAFKAAVGFFTHSIAIVLDAVNNVSDAASSVITIVGTRLAGKEPDKKHPFGHGRAEYLIAMIISVLVLYAGLTSLVASIRHILNPETPDYSTVSLLIVAVAVGVKILLGRYVKSVGVKVHSDSLVNSGEDATLDSVISASTLLAAGIFLLFGVSLEAWLGAVISLVIIKSGVQMLWETISKILGERNDAELAKQIRETVASFADVQGAYDLVLNNYGPDTWNGSIHIEVPETYSADRLYRLLREITQKVYAEHHVLLTAIGVYSVNTRDAAVIEARKRVQELVLSHEYVLQMHGFYLVEAEKTMRFDIVVSLDAKDRHAVCRQVVSDVQRAYPEYQIQATLDTDYAEE